MSERGWVEDPLSCQNQGDRGRNPSILGPLTGSGLRVPLLVRSTTGPVGQS